MIATPRTVGPRKLHVRQGSPEWLEARRTHITATAIPVLLGISPYRCEQDLADEMLNGNGQESTLVMRVGSALEDLIADAYAAQTGRKVRRVHGLWESRAIPWAAASPDATAAGRLVEIKWTGSRARFRDGLPDDTAAQVQWQLMVAEAPVADVATLTVGEDAIRVFEVRADPLLQGNFVAIAADFRRRLAEGGPFAQSIESVKRRYPTDDGIVLEGTPKWRSLAVDLARVRAEAKAAGLARDNLELAIRSMLAESAGVKGDGWEMTLRKNRDSTRTNWPAVAAGWRQLISERLEEAETVLSIHTETVPGPRVLRTSFKGDTDD